MRPTAPGRRRSLATSMKKFIPVAQRTLEFGVVRRWQRRSVDKPCTAWLVLVVADHRLRLTTSCLGHWFGALAHDARHPDVTLHRLRDSAGKDEVSRVLFCRSSHVSAMGTLLHPASLQVTPALDRCGCGSGPGGPCPLVTTPRLVVPPQSDREYGKLCPS
jgi:hypothetical protein